MNEFIYLASQSPRRAQLLEQIGVAHRLLLPNNQDQAEALEATQLGERPAAYVQRVTQLKLEAAIDRLQNTHLPSAPILCADTTVALGNTILGKPLNAQEAKSTLLQLSGRTHQVLTAVAMAVGQSQMMKLSVSNVQFAVLSQTQIKAYIDSQAPFGKAGAYGIQGPAAAWITYIEGSYSGIMGLPLCETHELMQWAQVQCAI
jgi:septum formation protein